MPGPRRAPPLPPAERRAAIADAVLPLLLARGARATTRALAEAAGVAEGTLFRAFADKHAIFHAAIERRLDPARLTADLAPARAAPDLRSALAAAVDAVRPAIADVRALAATAHGLPRGAHDGAEARRTVERWHATLVAALAAVVAPHAALLRHPPERVAALFAALLFADRPPGAAGLPEPLPPADLVDVLLEGVRARRPDGGTPCS